LQIAITIKQFLITLLKKTGEAGVERPGAAATKGSATIESSLEQLINGAQGYEKDR
jgi:hypothetical protein